MPSVSILSNIIQMLAFSEDDSLRSIRGCRKLHPRLIKSIAFSDKANIGENKYKIPKKTEFLIAKGS